MPSWPGLEIVFTIDPPGAIGARLSEYRAPVATAGLFTRDELHCLGLDENLLGQGLNDEQAGVGTGDACAYPTVIPSPDGRVSGTTHRYTSVFVTSPANRLAHVERREQRVAIH